MFKQITTDGIRKAVNALCMAYILFYFIQGMYELQKPLPDPRQELLQGYIDKAEYRMDRIRYLAEKVRQDCIVMDKGEKGKPISVALKRGKERAKLDGLGITLGFFLGKEAEESITNFIEFDEKNENPCAQGSPSDHDYKEEKNGVIDILEKRMTDYFKNRKASSN